MTKVAFLDRDGVINKEINYLHKVEDFEYTKDCIKGLLQLIKLGFQLVIVTNQAGIAKGIFSLNDYKFLTKWMLSDLKKKGIRILDCIYCPHHPDGVIKEYAKRCACRKPAPGMINYAIEKYNIDAGSSILIGDKISDIQSGKNAGIYQLFLVSTGHSLNQDIYENNKIYSSLLEVANYLEK